MKRLLETNATKMKMVILMAMMVLAITGCSANTAEEKVEVVETEAVETEAVGEIEAADDMADVSGDIVAVGEGETQFTFTVTFEDATMHIYEVSTDAAMVGDALLEEGLIAGEDSEYGLFVDTVDGVTLDWDTDGAYWAFYVDGDMSMNGVGTTEIVEGSTYTFAYAQ